MIDGGFCHYCRRTADRCECPDVIERAPVVESAEIQPVDAPQATSSASQSDALSGLSTLVEARSGQVAHLIERMQFARQSHLAWAEHIEAHAASGQPCVECDSKPYKLDPANEREWVAVYDSVLAVLAGQATLVEALKGYVQHWPDCKTRGSDDPGDVFQYLRRADPANCTCGLATLLQTAGQEKE